MKERGKEAGEGFVYYMYCSYCYGARPEKLYPILGLIKTQYGNRGISDEDSPWPSIRPSVPSQQKM